MRRDFEGLRPAAAARSRSLTVGGDVGDAALDGLGHRAPHRRDVHDRVQRPMSCGGIGGGTRLRRGASIAQSSVEVL